MDRKKKIKNAVYLFWNELWLDISLENEIDKK